MKRRAILGACAGLALFACRLFAQSGKEVRRIAFVHPGTRQGFEDLFAEFRRTLRDLGYVEGRDIVVDPRWAEGRLDLLPSLAAEAVAQKPAGIGSATSAGRAAFKKGTS